MEDERERKTTGQEGYRGERQLPGTPLEDTQMTVIDRIRRHAVPLQGAPEDYELLLRRIGDARLVLLGEATHGTHEFYRARAEITRRLILEKGFTIVAVEADWPDAYRANRFVQGRGAEPDANEALGGFKRFPGWMWRNRPVLDFVDWLAGHNRSLAAGAAKAGFYGLDLYSLSSSIEAVIEYLDRVDPDAAQRARYRYSCFEDFGEDPQAYGYAASFALTETCEREVVEQLGELRRQAFDYLSRDGWIAEDEFFYAEQNARIAQNAEQYYRSMFADGANSWNLRDRHMMETLEALLARQTGQGQPAKAVVWAHNSHLGDARATEMNRRGELNLGQLVRQRYAGEAVLVGFTTYSGTVTAASDWGGPAERKQVRPALAGSYEWLLHHVDIPRFLLVLSGMEASLADLRTDRLERAIGVIYRPQTERISHYFQARIMDQFDAVLHFDETTAVEPLERTAGWEAGEAPETYPTGL